MCSAASEMDAPTADLYVEQHVQCLEPGSFNSEEITRQNLLTIVTQQATPITAILGTLWCRWYVLAFEDVSNRRPSDIVAQLEQFAL